MQAIDYQPTTTPVNQFVEVNSDDYGIIQLIRQEIGKVEGRHITESEAVSWVMEFALVMALSQGSVLWRLKYRFKLRKLLAKYPELVAQLKAVWSL